MCIVVSRSKETATFHRKNGDLSKLVVDFLRETTFRKKSRQTLEIMEDFACEDKTLENLRRFRTCFLHVSFCFLIIFHFYSFLKFSNFFKKKIVY